MTTTRSSATTAAVLSLLLAAASGCGPSGADDGREASEIGTDTEAIDSSFLPKQFQTRWAPGIPGGVPRDNDPVRPAAVWLPAGNPYGGYSVNPALAGQGNAAAFTSAMQAAINAAGAAATPSSRRIVLLKAGTYYVNPQSLPNKGGRVGLYVTVDNVTIRGEGADRTRLVANGTIPEYGTVVLFGHRGGFNDGDFRVTAVTANAWMGTNTIAVTDASRFAVGDVITIDMLDGPATATGSVQLNASFVWFYDGEYFKRQPSFSWAGPSTGAPGVNVNDLSSANAAAVNAVPRWRSVGQASEITAISGNTLYLKEPLTKDFMQWRSPQVWRMVAKDNRSVFLGNRWSGIENIAVAGGNNQWGFPGGTIAFSYMSYAWAKNVEADGSRGSDSAHPGKDGYNIGLGRCYRCVIRDSYVHESRDQNPGGQAYGIVIGTGSSASLVENNISINNNKPIVSIASGGGNVIAYNYVDNAVIWNSPGWQENAIDDSHGAFTHHDLIEGNWTPNIGSATTHGNSGWHVHFRNYATGRNSSGNVTGNLRAVGVDAWTHDSAFVGNVLRGGNVYETNPSSRSGTPIFALGNNFMFGGNWDNGYAKAHIWRDGNWDSVNGRTVWASGARTLPPSLYLSSKPAFFGTRTWPWVDPLSGTVGTLPAKARYDSGTPNIVP
ncbi:MAG: hypothetical protein EHM78_12495 [Myxococcaceae bacterium]|nr:MAG: hypothetical protein EHM78_12495 [Myxococcaceae bacterium]